MIGGISRVTDVRSVDCTVPVSGIAFCTILRRFVVDAIAHLSYRRPGMM